MLRSSLISASAVLLCASASAQTTALKQKASTVKNAGIYHVATGTWTRNTAAQAAVGPDTVYKNDVGSGYFTTANASQWGIDEGVLPSTNNIYAATGTPGILVDEYFINCFSFAYCANSAVGNDASWDFAFYEQYNPCTDVNLGNAAGNVLSATFSSGALPTSQTGGQGCWIVTFDLSGGSEICMPGDGEGSFEDDTNTDSFGFGVKWTGQASASAFGPLLNMDPDWTAGLTGVPAPYGANNPQAAGAGTGGGTYYHLPSDTSCNNQHTGLATQDFWYSENTALPAGANCYFFGGYKNINACGGPSNTPGASFPLVLFADVLAGCSSTGTIGTNFGCPNTVPNSSGNAGVLAASGSDVAANNNVTLDATNLAQNQFGYFLNSQNQNPAGFTPPGSQGNLCIGPAGIGRYNQPGSIFNSGTAGAGQLVLDLPNTPTPSGNQAIVAGQTWYFTCWFRDNNPGNTSNFTDAICILFG